MLLMYQNNPNSKYINEIDSLRAIAVLGVLFFHLFPDVVTGGFIGVDIFFVISGFVISKSYLNILINKEIPFKQFWIKRIRRLMPAYLLVLIVTTILAYFLLEPHLLKNYGKSLIGQSFYIQNILFWLEGSYFDKAITKPLLHTWSLGVEEQFYIFFILLIIVSKKQYNRFILFLTTIAIFSIVLGYIVSTASPKTSFYLLPMRIWEFYLGILAYLIADKWKVKQPSKIWNLLLYFLTTLIITTFFFDRSSPFPGWQSLIACLSIFSIISILTRLPNIKNIALSNQTLQYIGKLSYSLYLWHWVIISLFVTGLEKELNLLNSIIIIIISSFLSYLSYTFVENPIRRKQILVSTHKLFSTTISLSVIIVLIGVFLIKSYGAVFRYDEPYRTWLITAQKKSPYRCGLINRILDFKSEICKINKVENSDKKGVLIIGDSHADQLDEVIAGLGEKYDVPVYLTVRNCNIDQYTNTTNCNKNNFQKVLNEIKKHNIGKIIAISYWGENGLEYRNFDKIVEILVENNLKVVLSETVPHNDYLNPVYRTKIVQKNRNIPNYLLNDYIQTIQEQRNIFRKLQNKYRENINLLIPSDLLCKQNICQFETNGIPNYIDHNHLSYQGVENILPMFESLFQNSK